MPSLKSKWQDSLNISWQLALADVKAEYKSISFPSTWQFSDDVEIMLNVNFWE
jgi:hypothetical protein